MIYLDNSATTYPKPSELYKALDYANRHLAFNAGRGHYKESNDASRTIDECRKVVSSFAKNGAKDVAFLSSATESLNLIISGLGLNAGDAVYISPFEHNAIIRPLFALKEKKGVEIIQIPFDENTWEPDYSKLEDMFSYKKPKAIFLSHISNVTGLILPFEKIFDLGKEYGSVTVLDCAQSYGVVNPDLRNVDFCVFAGHKSLYASFGVAGIISDCFDSLSIVKSGGTGSDSLNHDMPETGHERIESGSPNVVAIYGLLESCKWVKSQNIFEHERELTSYLLDSLNSVKKVFIYKPAKQERLLGIVSFNVEGYLSEEVSTILYDEFGIAVRSGYHCSPFVHDFLGSIDYKGTVRVSVGAFNKRSDIDVLISALKTL